MRHTWLHGVVTIGAIAAASALVGCVNPQEFEPNPETFPRETHSLTPAYGKSDTTQIASGAVTGEAPQQPVAFPHYTHVTKLEMSCEYCHNEARNSIHSGVPPLQTCMGCHSQEMQNIKGSAEIETVRQAYKNDTPLEWAKVHDLPDFVYFTHKRHVRAGVACTECHGQVGEQGRKVKMLEMHETEDGHHEMVEVEKVKDVMIRETTLQMGWCLDCHGTHPSIDENYGDQANLRRAELKDCWTCHK